MQKVAQNTIDTIGLLCKIVKIEGTQILLFYKKQDYNKYYPTNQ